VGEIAEPVPEEKRREHQGLSRRVYQKRSGSSKLGLVGG
jgi:hypothetical protein